MTYPTLPHTIVVLQVGDVILAQDAVRTELARWGYHALLLRASTLDELGAALDQAPDLVFCGLDHDQVGIETVQRVLRERQSSAALVAVCAERDEARAFEWLRAGVDDLLFKHQLQWLGPVVARTLNRRQMAARLAQDQLYIALLHETVGQAYDGALPSNSPRGKWAAEESCQRTYTRALVDLAGRLSASLDLCQVLATLCEDASRTLGCESCIAFLYEDRRKQFLPAGSQGIAPAEWARLSAIPLEINRKWAWVDQSANAISRPADGTHLPGSLLETQWGERRLVLAGMVYQDRWIGALGIPLPDPDWDTCGSGCTLFQAFANQAAVAVANLRFYQQLRNRAGELADLAQISSRLRRARSLTEIIPLLVSETVQALRADRGALLVLSDDRVLQAAVESLPSPDPAWQALFDQVASRHAFQDHRVYFSDPLSGPAAELGEDAPGMASSALALLGSADAPSGVLCLGYAQRRHFEEDEQRLLAAVAEMAGDAINRLRVRASLEQRIQVRSRELEGLDDIAGFTNQADDLAQILENCLETVLDALHVQTGMLHLLSEDKRSLVLAAARGIPRHNLGTLDRSPVENSLWGRMICQDRSLLSPDLRREQYVPDALSGQRLSVFLGSPIHARGETLGTISILRETGPQFNGAETALLETLADQIGAAIDGARLRQCAEESAILEERQRLARDLHDSVTQSLYSLSLLAEGYRRHTREARPEELDGWFTDLGDAAHQALKDMRLLLYELRPSSLQADGIVMALDKRLEAVEERSGIETHFKVEGSLHLLEKREEIELYQIAQEALNNSLKHAHATRVDIRLAAHRKDLSLEVRDDGVGFDATQIRTAGMGLLHMIDRAKKLGGDLFIHSWPGKGTRIEFYREDKQQAEPVRLDRSMPSASQLHPDQLS